jgi:EF-P beta-lysylation protein EpmB
MIPQTKPIRQVDHVPSNNLLTESWQQALADVIRTPDELYRVLDLDISSLPKAKLAHKDFALRVPRAFVDRMSRGDWQDPLLMQVLPQAQELDIHPGYSNDPLDEKNSNPVPGLIHKYHGRVLLVVTGGCAINCRYCFRRHFPYSDNNPSSKQWQQALDYIRNDNSIHEVIFSGGDPLAASDKRLSELVENIANIPHITTLRIHSRLPIVIPQRITEQCLKWMTNSRLKVLMVIHCNHANEIDENTGKMLLRLRSEGVTVLNQSVLLAGINDQSQALEKLSHRLFKFGVMPYYLHLLDKVQGAAHFHVSKQRAQLLIEELLAVLPGYLVPRLVQELPNALSKIPVNINIDT